MGGSSDGNCVNIFIIKTEVNTLLYFLTDPTVRSGSHREPAMRCSCLAVVSWIITLKPSAAVAVHVNYHRSCRPSRQLSFSNNDCTVIRCYSLHS